MATLSSNLKRRSAKGFGRRDKKDSTKEPTENQLERTLAYVYNKVMNYLARRNHSEKELREKLRTKFDKSAIDHAIEKAEQGGWIVKPALLAEQTAEALHRKKKGYIYIRQYLKKKGLPNVEIDRSRELEKARAILGRYNFDGDLSRDDMAKIHRLLINRGYDLQTVRSVINDGL